jgi:hypothetical protein
MRDRERQLWAEFVRKREERKDEKQARKRRAKKPQPTPAELDAALDDLVGSVKMLWGERRGYGTPSALLNGYRWSAPCRKLLTRAGPSPPSSRITH